jgi:sugar-specific transcriptional regulator TrmB
LKNEIKVYLQLVRAGEMKAADISEAISLHRTETYKILRELEKKGIVFAKFEKPLKFTSVPLDKAVDLLVDAQKTQIRLLEQKKNGLVELWRSIPKPKITERKKEMFQMLEGEGQVLTKVSELLEKTENEFRIFAASDYLSQLYYSDFSDELKAQSEKVRVTLVTDTSLKSTYFMSQLSWISDTNRISNELSLPCFIISDNKEVLLIFHEDIVSDDENRKKYRTAAVWTNYSAFVKILKALFSKIR